MTDLFFLKQLKKDTTSKKKGEVLKQSIEPLIKQGQDKNISLQDENQKNQIRYLIKGTKYGIETKSINLEPLMKYSKKNSNYKRYNMSLINNDHQKIKSTNYFNSSNCSQEHLDSKKYIGNYYIRW